MPTCRPTSPLLISNMHFVSNSSQGWSCLVAPTGDTLCDFGEGNSLRGAALRLGQPRKAPKFRRHCEESTDDKQRLSSPKYQRNGSTLITDQTRTLPFKKIRTVRIIPQEPTPALHGSLQCSGTRLQNIHDVCKASRKAWPQHWRATNKPGLT